MSQQKPYKPEESGGQYSTSLEKRTFNPESHIQLSYETTLHKRRKNKIFCEQASTQIFHHHQACFTRASERSTTHRKEQSVSGFPKIYQKVKSINIMKNLHQLMGKTAS